MSGEHVNPHVGSDEISVDGRHRRTTNEPTRMSALLGPWLARRVAALLLLLGAGLANAQSLFVTNETPAFVLDTRLPSGDSPGGSLIAVADSPPFTLDTRVPGGIVPSSGTAVAESASFALDTRMPDGVVPSAGTTVAESAPFSLDTRLPDGLTPSTAIVVAESPPFSLDTRLPDGISFSNAVVSAESPPFSLDTRLTLRDPFNTNLVTMAVSPPFTLDTQSGWFKAPAQLLTGGSTGGKARFSPDGLRLAKADGSRVLLWNLHSTRSNVVFSGHSGEVVSAEFSPLGDQLLTGSADGTMRWWDTASRSEVGRTNPPGSGTVFATYAPDGARVLAGRGTNASFLRGADMGWLRELNGLDGTASAVALASEGVALVGSAARSVSVWDTATGALRWRFTNQTHLITGAGIAPGGTNAMTASLDGTIRFWNLVTGMERFVIRHPGSVGHAVLSADGLLAASCDTATPGTAYVWDAQTGDLLRVFTDLGIEASQIKSVALSPDHTLLATTHVDGRVRLWDTGLTPQPRYPVTAMPIGTNLPVTLRSHGLYYFELEAQAGRSVVVTLEAAPSGSPQKLRSAGIPAGVSEDAAFANFGGLADNNVGAPGAPGGPRLLSFKPAPTLTDIAGFRMTAMRGALPSVYDYEAFAQAPVTNLHCEMPLAFTASGRAYVLVFAPYLAAGSINARLRAEFADFHLSSVSPNRGGNGGRVTAALQGTGFDQACQVALVAPTGAETLGQLVRLAGSTRMHVTFDLAGVQPGTRHVRLARPGSPTQILSNAFAVVPAVGPQLQVALSAPSEVRRSRDYLVSLAYQNVGDVDMVAPVIAVRASGDGSLSLPGTVSGSSSTVNLYCAGEDGLALLAPGMAGEIVLTNHVAAGANQLALTALALPANATPFVWNRLEAEFVVDGYPPSTWQSVTQALGGSWSEVMSHVADIAGRSGALKPQETSFDYLLRYGITESALVALHPPAPGAPGFDPERDVQLITTTVFDPGKCTVVLTHGFGGGDYGNPAGRFSRLAQALGNCGTYNVVSVDWQAGASEGGFWGVSGRIRDVSRVALQKLQALGVADFGCVVYMGESFGNAVNAWISQASGSPGHAIMFNPANPLGFNLFAESYPDYLQAFRNPLVFKTPRIADQWPRVGDRDIYLDCCPNQTGLICGPVDAHTSGVLWMADQIRTHGGCNNQWFTGTAQVPVTQNDYEGKVNCAGDFTPYSLADYVAQVLPKLIKPLKPIDDLYNLEEAAILAHRLMAVVRPIDPNDKIGPNGVGPNRVVSTQDEMEYMVRFENFASASAPVQELIVVDYLDAGLDWTTVRFKEIAYGDRIVTPPLGSQSFTVRDQPPTNSPAITGSAAKHMVVDVHGVVNPQTGRLEWRVRALDTNTSQLPVDALSGFLPPEDGTGRGQGHVKFGVRPKAELPLGTGITNLATIVFDGNDPIATPPVWNLVGDVPSLAAIIACVPGQITVGLPFSYTIGLTNTGSAAVTNVVLTNTLPAGMSLVSVSATRGTVTVTNGMVIWDLGTLTNGFGGALTITANPTQEGTFSNGIYFSGGSGLAVFNPPSEIVVTPAVPRLGIRLVGGQVVLFWSTNYAAFHPQRAGLLSAQPAWSDLTNAVQQAGAEYRVVIGPPAGRQWFRLAKSTTTATGPRLRITANESSVLLWWPTNAVAFQLQNSAGLGPLANWIAVTNQASLSGNEWRLDLGRPATRGFYRLAKP